MFKIIGTLLAFLLVSCAPSGVSSPIPTMYCQAQGALPDSTCTPGATLDVTLDQLCTPGYARSVRNVTVQEKDAIYASYGIKSHTTGQYEVDHLISLELGGSNDQANLWPEAASPVPGFHEKDKVENWLHDQVCSGKMNLSDAQEGIRTNWLQYWPLP